MDTKWKSSEIKQMAARQAKKILKRDEVFLLPGGLGIVLGVMMLLDILSYRYAVTE